MKGPKVMAVRLIYKLVINGKIKGIVVIFRRLGMRNPV